MTTINGLRTGQQRSGMVPRLDETLNPLTFVVHRHNNSVKSPRPANRKPSPKRSLRPKRRLGLARLGFHPPGRGNEIILPAAITPSIDITPRQSTLSTCMTYQRVTRIAPHRRTPFRPILEQIARDRFVVRLPQQRLEECLGPAMGFICVLLISHLQRPRQAAPHHAGRDSRRSAPKPLRRAGCNIAGPAATNRVPGAMVVTQALARGVELAIDALSQSRFPFCTSMRIAVGHLAERPGIRPPARTVEDSALMSTCRH